MNIVYRTNSRNLKGLNKEEEIIEAYLSGLPMLQLEHIYKVRRSALRRILVLNGVHLKTRKELRNSANYLAGFKTRKYKVCTDEIQQDIIKMYLNFDSPEIIAAKYEVTPRVIRGHLRKHGVEMRTSAESANNEKAKDRKEEACMVKYGVRNPLQHKDFFIKAQKSGHRVKSHSIGGIIFNNLQGYEPFGIDYLVNTMNILPKQIIAGRTKQIPTIRYDKDSKYSIYFPDIFIPHMNLLIEVKSRYTYDTTVEISRAKQAASKAAGYDHKILIFNSDSSINEII